MPLIPIVKADHRPSESFKNSLEGQKENYGWGWLGTKRTTKSSTPYVNHNAVVVIDLTPTETNKSILDKTPEQLAKYLQGYFKDTNLNSIVLVVPKVFDAPFGEDLRTYLKIFQDELNKLVGRKINVHAPADPNYTKVDIYQNKEGWQIKAMRPTGKEEVCVEGQASDVANYMITTKSWTIFPSTKLTPGHH